MEELQQFFISIGIKVDDATLDALKTKADSIANGLKDAFKINVSAEGMRTFTSAVNNINSAVSEVSASLSNITAGVKTEPLNELSNAVDNLKHTEIALNITENVGEVQSKVTELGTNIKKAFSPNDALNNLAEKAKNVVSSISAVFAGIKDRLSFDTIADKISVAFNTAKQKALGIIGGFGSQIKNSFQQLGISAQNALSGIPSTFSKIWQHLKNQNSNIVHSSYQDWVWFSKGIQNAASSIASKLSNAFKTVKGTIQSTFSSILSTAKNQFSKLSNAFSFLPKAASAAVKTVKGIFSAGFKAKGLFNGIKNEFDKVAEYISNKAQKLRNALTNAFKTGFAVLLGSAGIGALVNSVASELDALSDSSIRAGVSASRLSEFERIANLTDSSTDAVRNTLEALNKDIGEAANGVGKAAKAFETFHLSAKNTNGTLKTADQLLEELAIRSKTMDPAKFTAFVERLGVDKTMVSSLRAQGDAWAALTFAMKKYGYAVKDASGEAKSLTALASDLASVSAEEYAKVLEAVDDDSKNLVSIVADYQKVKHDLNFDENAAASAGSDFKDALGSVLEILQMIKRAVVTDLLGPWTKVLTELRRKIADNAKTIRTVIQLLFNFLLKVFGAVAKAINAIFTLIGKIISWFEKLGAADKYMHGISAAIMTVLAVLLLFGDKLMFIIKLAGSLFTLFSVGGALLLAKFALVIGAIYLLYNVLRYVYALYQDFIDYMNGEDSYFDWGPVAEAIRFFSQAVKEAKEGFKEFIKVFNEADEELKSSEQVIAAIHGTISALANFIKGLGNIFAGVFKADPDQIILGLTQIKDAISDFLFVVIPNIIKAASGTIITLLGALFRIDINSLKEAKNEFDAIIDAIFGKLRDSFNKGIGVFANLAAKVTETLGKISAATIKTDFLDNLVNSVTAAIDTVTNAFVGFSQLIAGLVLFDPTLIEAGLKDIEAGVQSAIETISAIIKAAGSLLTGILSTIFSWNAAKADEFYGKIAASLDNVASIVSTSVAKIKNIFAGIFDNMAEFGVLNDVENILNGVVDTIQSSTAAISNALDGLFHLDAAKVREALTTDLGSAFESLTETVESMIAGAGKIVLSIGAELGFDETTISALKSSFDGLATSIGDGLRSALSAISPLLGALGSIFTTLLDSLSPLLAPLAEFVGLVADFAGAIVGESVAVIGEIVGIFTDLFAALASGTEGTSVLKSIVSILAEFASLVTSGLSAALEVVADFIRILASFIHSLRDWASGRKSFSEAFGDFAKSVIEAFERIWDRLKTFGEKFKNLALDLLAPFIRLKDQLVAIWDSISTAIADSISTLLSYIFGAINRAQYAWEYSTSLGNIKDYDEWLLDKQGVSDDKKNQYLAAKQATKDIAAKQGEIPSQMQNLAAQKKAINSQIANIESVTKGGFFSSGRELTDEEKSKIAALKSQAEAIDKQTKELEEQAALLVEETKLKQEQLDALRDNLAYNIEKPSVTAEQAANKAQNEPITQTEPVQAPNIINNDAKESSNETKAPNIDKAPDIAARASENVAKAPITEIKAPSTEAKAPVNVARASSPEIKAPKVSVEMPKAAPTNAEEKVVQNVPKEVITGVVESISAKIEEVAALANTLTTYFDSIIKSLEDISQTSSAANESIVEILNNAVLLNDELKFINTLLTDNFNSINNAFSELNGAINNYSQQTLNSLNNIIQIDSSGFSNIQNAMVSGHNNIVAAILGLISKITEMQVTTNSAISKLSAQVNNYNTALSYMHTKAAPVPSGASISNNANTSTTNVEFKQELNITGVDGADQIPSIVEGQNRKFASDLANTVQVVSQKPKGE